MRGEVSETCGSISEMLEQDPETVGRFKSKPVEQFRECVALHTFSELRECRFDRWIQRGEAFFAEGRGQTPLWESPQDLCKYG